MNMVKLYGLTVVETHHSAFLRLLNDIGFAAHRLRWEPTNENLGKLLAGLEELRNLAKDGALIEVRCRERPGGGSLSGLVGVRLGEPRPAPESEER